MQIAEFRRYGIDLVKEPRVHVDRVSNTYSPRIVRNVLHLIHKVVAAPNPVLVKSRLPDWATEGLPEFVRKPSLDALGATLEGLIVRRG